MRGPWETPRSCSQGPASASAQPAACFGQCASSPFALGEQEPLLPGACGWALKRDNEKGASVCCPHARVWVAHPYKGVPASQSLLCARAAHTPLPPTCQAACPVRLWCPVFKGADTQGSLVRITLEETYQRDQDQGSMLQMGLGAVLRKEGYQTTFLSVF